MSAAVSGMSGCRGVTGHGPLARIEPQVPNDAPGRSLRCAASRRFRAPSWDERAWEVGAPLLSRFRALTYYGWHIQYDRDHARIEGYPGLVVHGPLQALLMAEVSRAAGWPMNSTTRGWSPATTAGACMCATGAGG